MDEEGSTILNTAGPHGLRKGDVVSITRIVQVFGWDRLRNPRFWFKPYRQLESKDTVTATIGTTITLGKREEGG